jgi:hypothetical protein
MWPTPFHTHSTSKTKDKDLEEKEQDKEWVRSAAPVLVPRQFKEGINVPEIEVFTTKSGSMTHEIFYNYAKHFVAILAQDHGPQILVLDGHSSRWSKAALL